MSEIIFHNGNAYKVKYKIYYSTFTNKKGEFVNDILVEYKKHLNIEHVLKTDDKYLCFCELIPDAEIIEEKTKLIENNEQNSIQNN
jgi:hypothetical protein